MALLPLVHLIIDDKIEGQKMKNMILLKVKVLHCSIAHCDPFYIGIIWYAI